MNTHGNSCYPCSKDMDMPVKTFSPRRLKKKKKVQGRRGKLQVAEMKREPKGPDTARPMEVAGLDVS